MRLHRFYVADLKITKTLQLTEDRLLYQWQKVLRFKPGQQVILFDGRGREGVFEIVELARTQAVLKHIADTHIQLPKRKVYLFWSIIKNDKNELVLQKCTELGVTHFIPIISERSEKKDINLERATRIVIEAAEQCGRGDIPKVYEPNLLKAAISEYQDKVQLFVAEKSEHTPSLTQKDCGVFIGPEGGWLEREKELFKTRGIEQLSLGQFVLRAETAAIVASSKLL